MMEKMTKKKGIQVWRRNEREEKKYRAKDCDIK